MKYLFIAFSLSLVAVYAQDSSVQTTTSVDINGRRVTDGPQIDRTRSANSSETTERMRSVNGRLVPIERVEERVLRSDAGGRTVERIIHRFDANGNPTAPVRETIDEQKRPDGSSTVQTTRYRGDINGSMQLVEKTTTNTQKSGSTETTQTEVQRPTANGIGTVEKKEIVRVQQGNGFHEDATTYRPTGNGGFNVAVRQTTEHTEQGGQSSDNTAEYEAGPEGRLQLHSQTVTNTVTNSDGSKASTVNVFGQNVPGTVDPTGKLKLYEQQLIDSRPGAGNSVIETLSVRRPTVSDPNTLGPAKEISETVCKGNCGSGANQAQ